MTKREQFIKEFRDLLRKYQAGIDISVTDCCYENIDVSIIIADSSLNSGEDFISLGNISYIDGHFFILD